MQGEDLNPPLTESGQFDGACDGNMAFLCLSRLFSDNSSASIDVIAWSTLRNCKHVSEGGESSRGIVVAELLTKKIVLKSSQEPAREMFLTRLCRWLGVAAPAIRFVVSGSDEYRQMSRAVHGMTLRPVVLVMEFVSGMTMSRISAAAWAKYFSCDSPLAKPVLRAIGRIMALDVLTNNWDRVPLIHDNRGNFGNVILQEPPDGSAVLVAIDNAMTGIRREYGGRRNPMYDAYLGKVRKLCEQLVASGKKNECALIGDVRRLIGSRTPAKLGAKEGLALQWGVAEMFCRIAKFDKLEEEKRIVGAMTHHDTWFLADLERVDLVFLGDVQGVIREYEQRLRKEYNV
jgi:hypothetical protein